jgi:hypothetical protein
VSLVSDGSPAQNGRDNDAPFVHMEIVEDSVTANTPAPSGGLQAFDVAAERVGFPSVQRIYNAPLVTLGSFSRSFLAGLVTSSVQILVELA